MYSAMPLLKALFILVACKNFKQLVSEYNKMKTDAMISLTLWQSSSLELEVKFRDKNLQNYLTNFNKSHNIYM